MSIPITIPAGPHSKIEATSAREKLALNLFDILWDRYRDRVSYVRNYESVIANAGATFVNDHVAFRTLAGQKRLSGIAGVSRIFESLGYRAAGCYDFPDKHLNAIHYQHPHPEFPKLFISELKTWELSKASGERLESLLSTHRDCATLEQLRQLASLEDLSDEAFAQLLAMTVDEFHALPWQPPERGDVEAVNAESQYAAWVMVHGYNVNHFTSLVNSHGVEALDDIEKTIAVMRDAGIPMKDDIEGEPGSKLRQSATQAVTINVAVRYNETAVTIPWSYAYFELAERNAITDAATGKISRFEGFLGPQATHLFEMTRMK